MRDLLQLFSSRNTHDEDKYIIYIRANSYATHT